MSKMRANRKQKINEKGKEKVKFILSKGINKVGINKVQREMLI